MATSPPPHPNDAGLVAGGAALRSTFSGAFIASDADLALIAWEVLVAAQREALVGASAVADALVAAGLP